MSAKQPTHSNVQYHIITIVSSHHSTADFRVFRDGAGVFWIDFPGTRRGLWTWMLAGGQEPVLVLVPSLSLTHQWALGKGLFLPL